MQYAVEPSMVFKVKEEYVQGKGSIKEIAERLGVSFNPLRARSVKEGWRKERELYLTSLTLKTREKVESRAEAWEKKVFEASSSDFDLVTSSIKGIVGSGDGGIDPETISGYARARKLLDDMARRSLGLVDPAVKLDITSAGKSLGESFVDALAKLRASPLPAPTSEEVDRILECEIVEESNEGV